MKGSRSLINFLPLVALVIAGSCGNGDVGLAPELVPAQELVVGPNEEYQSIQEAINAASSGDTILVNPNGTNSYTENITIDKRLTLLANGVVTISPADPTSPCLTTRADGTAITGFEVKGASSSIGILIYGADNCTVANNSVGSNMWGIVLYSCYYCTVKGNTTTENTGFLEGISPSEILNVPSSGVQLVNSCHNTIDNNITVDNVNGIDLESSHNNVISNNAVTREPGDLPSTRYDNGIGLFGGSSGNTIQNNTVTNYEDAIDLANDASSNIILGNTVSNSGGAICMNHASNDCTVKDNVVTDSAYGVLLWDSCTGNLIQNNDLRNNVIGVGFFHSCSDNAITGCTIIDNDTDIYSEDNCHNRVQNSTFETHVEDDTSSLEID